MTDFKTECEEFIQTGLSLKDLEDDVDKFAQYFINCLSSEKKLIFCGNGGSAADSIHIAGEYVGRFRLERKSLPAISLTADISSLTAIGNDYGYEYIFSRQIEGLANKGDILISLSTSGQSKNILNAVKKANDMGIKTLSLAGKDGGLLNQISYNCIVVKSNSTARIQEAHKFILHYICSRVDEFFA